MQISLVLVWPIEHHLPIALCIRVYVHIDVELDYLRKKNANCDIDNWWFSVPSKMKRSVSCNKLRKICAKLACDLWSLDMEGRDDRYTVKCNTVSFIMQINLQMLSSRDWKGNKHINLRSNLVNRNFEQKSKVNNLWFERRPYETGYLILPGCFAECELQWRYSKCFACSILMGAVININRIITGQEYIKNIHKALSVLLTLRLWDTRNLLLDFMYARM